jgi:hypothetical protein
MLLYGSKELCELLQCPAEKGTDSAVIGQVITILYGGLVVTQFFMCQTLTAAAYISVTRVAESTRLFSLQVL